MLAGMDEVAWLTTGEQDAWRAYLDGTRLLLQALDRQLAANAGISLVEYEVLVALSEAPDRRMRMRDLADALLATRSGATRVVERLERAGWVRRMECVDDRRGTDAELTEAGLTKLVAAAPGHVAAVRRYVFEPLTVRQVAHLGAIGGRLREQARRLA